MFHLGRSRATLLLKLMLVFALLLLPFAVITSSASADDQTPQPDPNQREVKVLKQEVIGNQVLTTVTIPASRIVAMSFCEPRS